MKTVERPLVPIITKHFGMNKKLIQILIGPRQAGKTTASEQIAKKWKGPVLIESADQPLPPSSSWIEHLWNQAIKKPNTLLILDEIQKVPGWSITIKYLWDKSIRENHRLYVMLLDSSSLLLQKGLTESLAGRFFLHRFTHWTFSEMHAVFKQSLDHWLFFGGYPGPVSFQKDFALWSQYLRDSLIESIISKDILQLQTVTKPALLRHLFMLATAYPSQILSYNKMLGQLQDAGNTTTLAHYLHLLESAFVISGLELYQKGYQKKRGSSPKLILWNNALINAVNGVPFKEVRKDLTRWGRLVENAVGAYLLNHQHTMPYNVYYWRKNPVEIDFVVETSTKLWAIEVKSGLMKSNRGMEAFRHIYPKAIPLYIGSQGIILEDFFQTPPKDIFS